jgi:hypothetical protein
MNNLIKVDTLSKQMAEAGFNLEDELLHIETGGNGIDLPRIRIEHKENGKHRLYIDYGENYLADETQEETLEGNTFKACIFAEQFIRALWDEGELLPRCSAVDAVPTVEDPVKENCKVCPESAIGSQCKPKVRLWLLTDHGGEIKTFVMNLSPTSIKHWNAHKKRLKRSKLPVVAVNTVFSLEDIKKNSYRWAEVNLDIDGIATKEMLLLAKQYRDELNRIMSVVTEKDFDEKGDKVSS